MHEPPVTIEVVANRRRQGDWLKLPYAVHAGDAAWIPPLLLQERLRTFTRANPFFAFGRAACFLAYRGARVVGRISAQINDRYREHYGRAVGHFGFFVCEDDEQAARGLVDAAASWLKAAGAVEMAGPFSFSINEECGLLVEGFDTPAAFLMNHARPYSGRLLEAAGLVKEMDSFAYRMSPRQIPAAIVRLADRARKIRGMNVRKLNRARFAEDIGIILDIYDDAWRDNWGFVPFADVEVKAMARELKPFLRAGYGRIVEMDGEPVAMILALPDLNDIEGDFGGRLLPFNWAKLAWRLWKDKARSARIVLLGIRKAHQGTAAAAGILALMVSELLEESKAHDLNWVEFSWVLEVNKSMNALGRLGAGEPVKRYRIYRKPLG
jgi:hypothetical protein